MAGEVRDLWPQDIGGASLLTPVTILRQQATLLGQKTNQLVVAEVNTQSQGPNFQHSFVIVAPALDNYRYELFSVHHGITFYPMTVVRENSPERVDSQEQFLGWLRTILSSPRTKNIVQSLLAQIAR